MSSNKNSPIDRKYEYCNYLFLFAVFTYCIVLYTADQVLYLDGSRYTLLHLDRHTLYSSFPYWRFSTKFYQLPSYFLGFFDSLFQYRYIAYKAAYSFQPFVFLLITLGFFKKYRIEKLFVYPIVLFSTVHITNSLFVQSHAFESLSYYMPALAIIVFFRNTIFETIVFSLLISAMTFGYEPNIIPVTIFLFCSLFQLKTTKERKNWILVIICIIALTLISIPVFFIIPVGESSRFFKSLMSLILLERAYLWAAFIVVTIYTYLSYFNKKNILYIRNTLLVLISFLLTYYIFRNSDLSTISYFAIDDNFVTRVSVIPLTSCILPALFFLFKNKALVKKGDPSLYAFTFILFFLSFYLYSSGARLHGESVSNIKKLISESSGCRYIRDSKIIKSFAKKGVITNFLPYYSVILQQQSKIKTVLFAPYKGWGGKDGVYFDNDTCKEEIPADKQFLFFIDHSRPHYFRLDGGKLDPQNVFSIPR